MIVPDTGKQFYRNVLFSFWQPVSKKLFAVTFPRSYFKFSVNSI
ncbi:hypothetical protein LEP1GSC137_2965 [Leptospira borgpetersenii str. Noumea 25]|uniref:Uncharacterized protein n=1 Tax=Leptospira borgpetersenii serovar Ballum TaxID=280505 RepID=A0A0S2ILH8_LEPBO|nr:hypothetical protein LBBP_00165 [Leptospira borgpetersenii serovar Ballum]EKQ98781.1 hypothetical protein LEP1GSC121_0430 [Leptospira borgpetersenii serovar Castellonis str. 200801910]EMO09704.1 hypothetical protein LEP1GSC137_2965 [Leptospira borgpetersenii str. Noumea 25]